MASLGARKVSLEDLARAAEYLQLQDLLDLVTVKVRRAARFILLHAYRAGLPRCRCLRTLTRGCPVRCVPCMNAQMATLIVGRTLDQAFDAFGFRHDPSDEANARVLAEYPWLLGPL